MAKKKLTFFTFGEDMFLRDIIINLRKEYDIKFFQRQSEDEFFRMYHDCDIAWFEWCDQLIINATQSPKIPPKVICRLHSYEFFTDMPAQVDWNKIDKLVFVSETVQSLFKQKFNCRPDIMTCIENGVNMEKFTIPENKQYNKRVVFLGLMNYKKGPELLLQCFSAIHKYDPSFNFHIAGDHQDERIALYYDYMAHHLPFKINFDGWIKDPAPYLTDKDFVISTSLFESFQYSVAEGMAQGLIPLVHNWPGSLSTYPNNNIFLTTDQCVDIIRDFENLENKDVERKAMREFIGDNYSLDKQMQSIREMLQSL